MRFGQLFGQTYKDFKDNFSNLSKANFLFFLLPYLVILLVVALLISGTGILSDGKEILTIASKISSNSSYSLNSTLPVEISSSLQSVSVSAGIKLLIILGVFSVLLFLSCFIMIFAYLFNIMVKKDSSFKVLFNNSKKYYWKFAGLGLLFMLISFAISLIVNLILIPFFLIFSFQNLQLFSYPLQIIMYLVILFFMVRICFAPFILVLENKGVFESISLSWKMSKRNWMGIFRNLLIMWIIFFVIGLLFYILALFIIFSFALPNFNTFTQNPSSVNVEQIWPMVIHLLTILPIIYTIYVVLISLVVVPFFVLFTRNLYYSIRQNK